MKKSSYISLQPADGQTDALAAFLKQGADIVLETEPQTLLWTALQVPDTGQCAIFDTFPDESARDAHFAGKVAKALHDNASTLLEGGWDMGVLPNIQNATILGSKISPSSAEIKLAVWISLDSQQGKEQDLADLLKVGADIVNDTEPETHYWFALQIDERCFGIIDFFTDQKGIDSHFAGQAAAAVHKNAEYLIEGGWEQGVLARVQKMNVLSFFSSLDTSKLLTRLFETLTGCPLTRVGEQPTSSNTTFVPFTPAFRFSCLSLSSNLFKINVDNDKQRRAAK